MLETRTTRRRVLTRGLGAAGACLLIAIDTRLPAAAKTSKATLLYQDRPHDGQRCGSCKYFAGDGNDATTGTCALVEGVIARDGWCMAYASKA